ncbi:Ribonuclease VapC11 [invertebrate metagenome]|uniref:Ribonuclease VapC11 n=1 Tax=invertebrate metagenome TaxID=1711999 RepID=A0A2H9T3E6_9ZZZZ
MDCLVDTSVWVDFLNGQTNVQVEQFRSLLLAGSMATTSVVIMEILQGIRSDRQCRNIQQKMKCLTHYAIDEQCYVESAMLYRQLRKKGVTIRKSVDCLIAAVCIHYRVPILHRDRDFSQIVAHSDLMNFAPDIH